MVKPYIYTEWGYRFESSGHVHETSSALIAREIVNDWNRVYGIVDPAEVVQRSISEWGTEQ